MTTTFFKRLSRLPFKTRAFKYAATLVTVGLLGAVLLLGWWSSKKVTEVVTADFNQQQLVLARHVAGQIENSLNKLKREISLLSLSPSVQYREPVFLGRRMGIAFSSIVEDGGLEIRFVDSGRRKVHVVDAHGYQSMAPYPVDLDCLAAASDVKQKGELIMGEVTPSVYGTSYMKLVMRVVQPVWQVSVDDAHPVAKNEFAGALVLLVDVTALIEKITKGIVSGKTGYSWVIDGNGTFLYHPVTDFIGKNAFEARREKRPSISYVRINEIQRDQMLAGREGTSWYISGWHKGVEGEIKKLIAYAPVNLGAGSRIWAVAVVAPMSEIEGALRPIHLRQFSLQAVVILVVLLGSFAVMTLILGWKDTLEREVSRKTHELEKSESKYRSLVEGAEDLIFTVDLDGRFLSVNEAGAKFLGLPPEYVVGRSVAEVVPWPSGELMLMTVREVFEFKKGRQITHPIRVGEREYWLNTYMRRLMDEDGQIYAVLGISRDITGRKKMEEQSYYTEKLASIGTLAAGVAHEINNPLAVILGFTDLLLERAKPGSEEYDALKTIERQGLNAKRVVENLLSFSRYSERKEEMVDVNECMRAVLKVIGNKLQLDKINVRQELEEALPPIRGNAGEMQQVFFNLINNSIFAMSGGGDLTLKSRRLEDGRVEVRISDTGHGIRKEHRARVFEPLFTTQGVGKGTGLGLSVSYGIITNHGGTITFETRTIKESADHGTTFIITLPTAADGSKL